MSLPKRELVHYKKTLHASLQRRGQNANSEIEYTKCTLYFALAGSYGVSVAKILDHWSLTRSVNLRVTHSPAMPGTFSSLLRVSYHDIRHGTSETRMPWYMAGSLTFSFLRSRWQEKRSRHTRRMRNPQLYVSCTRPMACVSSGGNSWGYTLGSLVLAKFHNAWQDLQHGLSMNCNDLKFTSRYLIFEGIIMAQF